MEILGGDGLDPHLMTVAENICGIDSIPSKTTKSNPLNTYYLLTVM